MPSRAHLGGPVQASKFLSSGWNPKALQADVLVIGQTVLVILHSKSRTPGVGGNIPRQHLGVFLGGCITRGLLH